MHLRKRFKSRVNRSSISRERRILERGRLFPGLGCCSCRVIDERRTRRGNDSTILIIVIIIFTIALRNEAEFR